MSLGAVQTIRPAALAQGGAPFPQHQQLTVAAQRFVAQAFFGTLLKQMHDSPFASEVFSGGRGGQAFSSLLDQQLTERMGRAPATQGLADSVVHRIEKRSARAAVRAASAAESPAQPQPTQKVTDHVPAAL
jgi:Rod binding domain-containing protein